MCFSVELVSGLLLCDDKLDAFPAVLSYIML